MDAEILQKMADKAGCKIEIGLEKYPDLQHLAGARKIEANGIEIICLRSQEACLCKGEFLIAFIHELLHIICKDDQAVSTALLPTSEWLKITLETATDFAAYNFVKDHFLIDWHHFKKVLNMRLKKDPKARQLGKERLAILNDFYKSL